jgi:hypothetical protein
MSFIALRQSDGEPVVPEEVDNGVDVECPECAGVMRGRGPSRDGRPRHFFHLSDTDCPGGESVVHRKQKSLAVSALRVEISEYRRCELEVGIDISDTRTGVDTRRADVLLEYKEEHGVFGRGIIVEVQYRNRNKNIPATTFDYLSKGYSVIWANQDAFTDQRFLLHDIILEFDTSSNTYRPTSTRPIDLLPLDPPTLNGTKHYFDERVTGPDSPTMRDDDDCKHRWIQRKEFCYECPDCDAKLHANPTILTEDSDEFDSESETSEDRLGETGYVISLAEDTSFEDFTTFRTRGTLIEVRSDRRDCRECGEPFEHIIGWDGLDLYSPGRLVEQIKGKPYESLRKVDGRWVRCCPECGATNQLRGTETADLYYASQKIDTVWIPEMAPSHLTSF